MDQGRSEKIDFLPKYRHIVLWLKKFGKISSQIPDPPATMWTACLLSILAIFYYRMQDISRKQGQDQNETKCS